MRSGLRRAVGIRGRSLHAGLVVGLRLCPAAPGAGLRFFREDLPGSPVVPARWENLCDSRRATGLALGEARVGTPEHLLAAIAAMALDDLDIFLDGPELPILDGGARVFLRLLEEAGRRVYPGERPVLRLRRPLQLRVDRTEWHLRPAELLRFDLTYDHPQLGLSHWVGHPLGGTFQTELAGAPTFGLLRELQPLLSAGLARGAGLDNTVVYAPRGSSIQPISGSFPANLPARHAALDLLGDLCLLGAPLLAHVQVIHPGHAATHALLRHLFAESALEQDARGVPGWGAMRMGLQAPWLDHPA